MIDVSYPAILIAAVAAFVFAALYYAVLAPHAVALGAAWAQRSRPPAWLMALEFAKSLVVATVVATLVSLLGITGPAGALLLGLALWIAFPVVLLLGSVTQEDVPWKLAAIHAGDWLVKLLLMAVIPGVWRA
jgi:hypothetical protein